MVGRWGSRSGGSSLGCAVTLVLFAAALYYGAGIGQVYLRYYRLLDAMRFQASIAPSVDNTVIARRLDAVGDSIFGQAPRFRIDRGSRRITIEAQYRDSVNLPFFKHTFQLRPRTEAPL